MSPQAGTGAGRAALIGVAVFALDRVSKLWVIEVLDLPALGRIDVASPWLTLLMAWNTGVNFGLMGAADLRWLLVGLAVAISAGVLWWLRRKPSGWLAAGGGLLIGGALGNAWDRVQYGAVADFLNMSCCGIQNPYAFNIADVAIFAGALLIAWKA